MLTEPTITKLNEMKLFGMANAYERQRQDTSFLELGFDERLTMLVENEWLDRQNRAYERRINAARLKHNTACIEDIDWQTARGLQRPLLDRLANTDWIRYGQNVMITGPTEFFGFANRFFDFFLSLRSGYKGAHQFVSVLKPSWRNRMKRNLDVSYDNAGLNFWLGHPPLIGGAWSMTHCGAGPAQPCSLYVSSDENEKGRFRTPRTGSRFFECL